MYIFQICIGEGNGSLVICVAERTDGCAAQPERGTEIIQ